MLKVPHTRRSRSSSLVSPSALYYEDLVAAAVSLSTSTFPEPSTSSLDAGYDPPFRLRGRHNEVWVVAKEEAAPSSRASLA